MKNTTTSYNNTSILFDEEYLHHADNNIFLPKIVKGDIPQTSDIQQNFQGRGTVFFFQHQSFNLVLRHYRRGGLIRHIIYDSYWFSSLDNTRMWKEYHLLQTLHSLNLPAPKAIAARCIKTSPFTCRGDLITQAIPNTQTLAEVLTQREIHESLWKALGHLIALFHQHNVYHADLNANNILLDTLNDFYLIDFDRCEIRSDSSKQQWKSLNLKRLLRSLNKLSKKSATFHFTQIHWQQLINAYNSK